jgi:outer membrane protein TolC
LAAAALPAFSAEPRLLDRPFLASLRAEAARHHPAAAAARMRETAAGDDVRGVRLWDDPSVGLALMAAESEMRRGEGDIRLSFEQPLPKRGLYQANLSKADATRRAALENSRMTALEIGAAAARDVIELALADESIRLESAQISWLETMAGNAREMTLNPGTSSTDALRLDSELAKENSILAAARRSRDGIAMRLNLRLGRPLESPWPALRLPDAPLPVPIAAAEIARIPRVSPKVRGLRETAAAAGAEVRIAETDRSPQFSLGVETSLYSGGEFRSAGVGLKMSLPVFNQRSYDARIAASHHRENAAGRDVESARLEVAEAVVSATTEAANAASQAAAYAGPIRQRALDATNSVQAAWISSTAGLTDLLDSNRQLFSIRLEQRRLVAMQLAALEDLNLLGPHD